MGFYVALWLPRFRNVVLLCFWLVAPLVFTVWRLIVGMRVRICWHCSESSEMYLNGVVPEPYR